MRPRVYHKIKTNSLTSLSHAIPSVWENSIVVMEEHFYVKNVIIIISALWYRGIVSDSDWRPNAIAWLTPDTKRNAEVCLSGGLPHPTVTNNIYVRACCRSIEYITAHQPSHLLASQPHSGPVKSEKTKGKKIKKRQEDVQDNTTTEHNQPEGIEHSIRRRDYCEKKSSSQIGDVVPNKRPST